MNTDGAFEERRLEGGAALLVVDGKLRGSRARSLGERLRDMAEGQVPRVVLDLRGLVSMDSVGRSALDDALELGLRLDVVQRRGVDLDECLGLEDRGVRFYSTIDGALGIARSRSGRALQAV